MRISLPLLLSLLFLGAKAYLEIQLLRTEAKTPLVKKGYDLSCITKAVDEQIDKEKKEKQSKKEKKKKKNSQDDDDDDDDDEEESIDDEDIQEDKNYEEICYVKDISYSMPINLNHTPYWISIDTTAPVSWVKGTKCYIEGTSKKCSRITQNFKDSVEKLFKHSGSKKRHSKNDYAMIEGSSQLVKGFEQKVENFTFHIRDSSRLTSILELLMLGFYIREERQAVTLEQTTVINATEVSKNLNYLCDGAISFRFDENSEKSFLKQLFEYQKTTEKVVTIYIDQYNVSYITVGEIATKYAQYGYGGIDWISVTDDDHFGKLPTITGVIIDNNGQTYSQISEKEYPAVISLSASYIGIPKNLMSEWSKKFTKKSACQIDEETDYLTCKRIKQEDENKIITFQFDDKKISFTLAELILRKEHSKTVLNMKQTIHDNYAILGQPFFKKYLVVFDYGKNKIGVSTKKQNVDEGLINVISLVRFICFVFLFGCCFIICFTPIQKCYKILKDKGKYGISPPKGQTRRLKQYSPVQENPYDQLSGQIKDALEEDQD